MSNGTTFVLGLAIGVFFGFIIFTETGRVVTKAAGERIAAEMREKAKAK